MNFQVTNREISVGSIQMVAVTAASVLLIGDTDDINLVSFFDTPPESLIVGLPPVSAPRGEHD
ncbi:spore gernimation protein GerPD [Fictibacillus sp. Mic-4]|uniref:hypothetical protein n=1 Tax=Fictibacillus TaxID=1329200 RepID=UPI00041B19D3|nr:hypothetical protein [Fictibacillus gelatini]